MDFGIRLLKLNSEVYHLQFPHLENNNKNSAFLSKHEVNFKVKYMNGHMHMCSCGTHTRISHTWISHTYILFGTMPNTCKYYNL